jgi:hypothetical protein
MENILYTEIFFNWLWCFIWTEKRTYFWRLHYITYLYICKKVIWYIYSDIMLIKILMSVCSFTSTDASNDYGSASRSVVTTYWRNFENNVPNTFFWNFENNVPAHHFFCWNFENNADRQFFFTKRISGLYCFEIMNCKQNFRIYFSMLYRCTALPILDVRLLRSDVQFYWNIYCTEVQDLL